MTAIAQRKPFAPIPSPASRRDMMALKIVNPITRDRMTTLMVSQEAFDVIYREGEARRGSFGGIAGIVVDYLARNGHLGRILDEALAEHRKS